MATQLQTVAEAEAALFKAKAEAQAAKVEEAKAQLKELRVQAKKWRARLAVVGGEIRQRDARVAALLAEREKVDYAIGVRTSPNGDLLFDPDDFTEQVEDLKAYREEIIEKARAENERGASRDEATTINQELIRLQFVARSLVNIIENRGKFVGHGGVASIG